ncbi:MAG: YhgE/Pip domain-containing protein [Bowdeniella nasicola]|nr:YhgE/Pip domain-containing protein [Bowdeniella nasicola]
MKRRTLTAIVAAIVLPLLASLMSIGAFAQREDRLPEVPAAVVNEDEGALMELDGKEQEVPLGRLIAAELVDPSTAEGREGSLDWQLVDADRASHGLASGEFYAVVTIPAEFSENLTTIGTPEATQARISVQSNAASSELITRVSEAIARAVAQLVGAEFTEQLLDGIYVGFDELGDGLDTAADGAADLTDGAQALSAGSHEGASGAQQLADNLPRLADGARQLAGGARQLTGGAAALAEGTDQVAGGARQLTGGANALADGADQASTGLTTLAHGLSEYAANQHRFADGMSTFADGQAELADGARQLADGTAQIRERIDALPPDVKEILEGEVDLSTLDDILAIIEPLPGQIDDAIDPQEAERIIREAIAALEVVRPQIERIVDSADETAERMREVIALLQGVDGTDLPAELRAIREGVSAQVRDSLAGLVERCESSGADPVYCADLAAGIQGANDATQSPAFQAFIERLEAYVVSLDPTGERLRVILEGDGTSANPGLIAVLDSIATELGGDDGALQRLDSVTAGLVSLIDSLGGADGVIDSLNTLRDLMVGTDGHSGLITMLRGALPELPGFYEGVLQLIDATEQLADGAQAAAAGGRELAHNADQLAGGADALADGAGQAGTGVSALAGGAHQLADGASQLTAGAGQAADGARRLSGGAEELSGGARDLAFGSDQAAGGSVVLAQGLAELAGGSDQLASGAEDLADGLDEAASQVPRYDDAERDRMVEMGTSPVRLSTATINDVNGVGTDWFPPLAPLMLWLGAIATFLILPAVPRDARTAAASGPAAAWAGWWPAAGIGVLQALVLAAMMGVLGVHPIHPLLTTVALVVMAVAFAAVMQAFQVVFGSRLGAVMGLAFLVLQGIALGGILPYQTAPAPVQALHGVLPVGTGEQVLTAWVLPGGGGSAAALLGCLAWGLLAFVITIVSIGRRQTITTDELRAAIA